jgi:hypothetical protein
VEIPTRIRRHIVITGTGRAGTSFLMQLLTKLGLDTGFSEENMQWHETARAGLEWDIRNEGAPYIVKSPFFCEDADEVLQRGDIVIDHVLIPMRDLYAAAESRRLVFENTVSGMPLLQRLKARIKPPKVPGGLVNTKSKRNQEQVLLRDLSRLLLVLAGTQIPVTLLQYPKLVKESAYLYEKLKPILGSISSEQFCATFKQTVRPEWVHTFPAGKV